MYCSIILIFRTHESCVVYKVIIGAGLSLDDINMEEFYDCDGQSISTV